MFERFTDTAVQVIQNAQTYARQFEQSSVGSEQLLLGIATDDASVAAQVLTQFDVTVDRLIPAIQEVVAPSIRSASVDLPFTPSARRALEQSVQEALRLDQQYVQPEHILLGLVARQDSLAVKLLQNLNADLDGIREHVLQALESQKVPVRAGSRLSPQPQSRAQTTTLDEFGKNLTQAALAGQLDPVMGRAREIERVVQILGRRTKNNPVLIGEPGVGKTAIAEGLAQRIVQHDVPEILWDKQVISLDLGLLVAGTRYRGEFEERVQAVLNDVRSAGNIILVIDEIHTLMGAGAMGGSLDAANMMKPALARGELQCIGATTLDEYRQYIERDAALERRFQPVQVGEPSVTEALAILNGLRKTYEDFHQVEITDAALDAAVRLSNRYIRDRFLPDKAIDLIDEAGSRRRLQAQPSAQKHQLKQTLRQITQAKDAAVKAQDFQAARRHRDRELALQTELQVVAAGDRPQVKVDDIAQIVAAWTGVPVTQLTETESAHLLHLEARLHERVIGQEAAVTAVAKALRRSRVGLSNPNRPIASFFFSGPTGVGKTELAKALAAIFFGSEASMIRFDMSEYMEPHTASKLMGAPPGFVGYGEGGELTEAVRRKPYSVILFDEVEKAHPDIFNLLLQVLDDGQLTDAQGRTVNFKNTLIIMTSNLGAKAIEKGGTGLGFDVATHAPGESHYQHIRSIVLDELKQFFRPEFLNRLDDVIVFRPLDPSEMTQIAGLMLDEVAKRLAEQAMTIQVSDALKAHLVNMGYQPAYGARSLRRVITQVIEDALADALLRGDVRSGDAIALDLDDQNQVIVQAMKQLQPVG
jgi:ATP-dependent Clp protease ATP-binding subunit ClpC